MMFTTFFNIQAVKVTCRENKKDGHAENFESTVKTLVVFLKARLQAT